MPTPKFRGAFPSPPQKVFACTAHRTTAIPPSFGIVPPTLQMWGNSQYGDCVSAEEASSKAMFSVMCGLPELLISDADLIAFARKHGFLNGANLTDVMDVMISVGLTTSAGVTWKDGPYTGVDWTDFANLGSAILQGPVKIAISAGQVETAVNRGNDKNGWYLLNARKNLMSDHCVGLWGFGPANDLFEIMKVPLPSAVTPSTPGAILETWQTAGFIDMQSLAGICTEAWLRGPTTIGQSPVPTPTPVPPGPTPGPSPVEPMIGSVQIGIYQVNWSATINDPVPPLDHPTFHDALEGPPQYA